MNRLKIILGLLIVFSPSLSAAEYGPWATVVSVYQQTTKEKPFVYFSENAMPGCYRDKGGYLTTANAKGTDRTFSVILTALTAGREVRVYYVLNDVDEGYNGWGLCDIEAIHIR